MATERQLRAKYVDTAKSYINTRMGSEMHHRLVDRYNAHKPLARGYPLEYTDDWCSSFVSSISIQCGFTEIIPTEVSCGKHIELFKDLGRWIEDDTYRPKPGDLILYDWDDSGKGDNQGWPDHIGIVEKVENGQICVIEGNMGSPSHVGRRDVPLDGKHIRGFAVPDYAKLATPEEDGIWGKITTKQVQQALRMSACDGVVSGQSKRNLGKCIMYSAINQNGWQFVNYSRATGSPTIAKLQALIGVYPDGLFGTKTVIALQRYLGIKPDGKMGKITVRAVQRWAKRRIARQ